MLANFLKWISVTLGTAAVVWLAAYCLLTIAYYLFHGIVFGP